MLFYVYKNFNFILECSLSFCLLKEHISQAYTVQC